ncbi:MAG: YifB family Mg chelatase-like AAA ATPase [Clostridiales bacterium]|nr:YifB family Mg chelatase-like AAA ATPase [Clostridiales bacterium]
MLTKVKTVSLTGLDGTVIEIQTDISNGIVAFDIIGLPDATVREARERAKSAIKNCGCEYPKKRITMNLAPAAIKKEGAAFDLAITLSVLDASKQIDIYDREDTVFIGELGLDGSLKPVRGILPMVISAYEHGFKRCFVPADNADEAAIIGKIDVYPVTRLNDIIDHYDGIHPIEPVKLSLEKLDTAVSVSLCDMHDVKGQEEAKRAIEVGAGGLHNILMSGPAGTGKSMLAKRVSTILPDMTFAEMLEVTKLHSIAGTLPAKTPLITTRPFRSPHHTVSAAAMSGGGSVPKPGELSLAHCGVLFLDELPEFHRDTLEVLRQPLEDGVISISRVSGTLTYPCDIMLISAMNPCPCGNLGNPNRVCTCTPHQVQRYRAKISAPLLDRIDIQIEVPSVEYDDLSRIADGDTSAQIKERVNKVRKIQLERYENEGITANSQLTAPMLDKYCALGDDESRLLKSAFERLGLSARAHSKILKVARTIADFDASDDIKSMHIAEAIQYRNFDRTGY